MINIDEYRRIRKLADKAWEDAWSVVDRLHALNAGADPDEVYRVVTEAVEETREEMLRERHEQQQRAYD